MTFYAYFPSRAALMRTLVEEQLNGRLERIRTGDGASTAESLVAAVDEGTRASMHGWLRQTAERWSTIRPLLRVARAAAATDVELRDLVDSWLAEAVDDIITGLEHAGRVAPRLRRFRGALALAALDEVAQNFDRADWGLTRDEAVEELTSLWCQLLEAR